MHDLPPEIEVYPVQHLPILKAYADQLRPIGFIHWEEVGVLAQTPPTRRRPGTFYHMSESRVTLDDKAYRALVVHSSGQDQRR